MPDFIIQQPEMLLLLLIVPVLVAVFKWRSKLQQKDIAHFGSGVRGRRSEYFSMEPWRLVLLILATLSLIAALTRPAINPQPKMIAREGRDVVFLLDVSNSMLAEDLLPNRLDSAKDAIATCVQSLENHRVGLIVFAGSSSIKCPLTLDTGFFLESLDKAGPNSVAHGGTRIGDALLKACDKLFSDTDRGYKDIILLSDGGDQSDGMQAAIEQLNKNQVRLIAIGLGDPNQGARIPNPYSNATSEFLMYKGAEVWSKLDAKLISQLVDQTQHAAYIPVDTRKMQLDEIYAKLSASGDTQQLAEESVMVYEEIFHWFIGLTLLLLSLMMLTPHHYRRLRAHPHQALQSAIIILTLLITHASADTSDFFKLGNQSYRNQQFEKSIEYYQQALEQSSSATTRLTLRYNLANAYYQSALHANSPYDALTHIEHSIQHYRIVLDYDRSHSPAGINNELARTLRKQLKTRIEHEEEKRKQMQADLDKIRAALLALIEQQKNNIPTEAPTQLPESWKTQQTSIKQTSSDTDQAMQDYHTTHFDGLDPSLSPLKNARSHLMRAIEHQALSLTHFDQAPTQPLEHARASQADLEAALLALPQDPEAASDSENQDDASNEDEEGESSDEGEESEGEPSDAEQGQEGEAGEMQAGKIDLNSLELPPPSNTPEDIIRMSQELQQARQAKSANKKGSSVEKDW
ncbi:VWA domain-containing protein [Rubritalea tangerina]|uniref:VWA domain-containing protein n=1 Tax=Rubritalea tangerina TaxID=430798 RepID=A0ABW4ZCX3_9BACT